MSRVFRGSLEFFFQITFISQLMPFSFLGAGGILWFLSASIIAGALALIVFQPLRKYGKNAILIYLFISIVLYNNIINTHRNLDLWNDMVFNHSLHGGVQRALAGVFLGVFLGEVRSEIRNVKIQRWVIICGRLALVILSLGTVVFTVTKPHTEADAGVILIFCIILLIAEDSANRFESRFTDLLDQLCMPVYIFQVCSIMIVTKFIPNLSWTGAIFAIVVDVGLSFVWVKATPKINFKINGK